jgi:tRNA pseudouridine38-40 synthase
MDNKEVQRFKMRIEYDGTDFVGWQIQNNGRSVQGEMERVLRMICGGTPRVHGSGRTDAGVHAEGQVAHVDLATRLSPAHLRNALNAELPADVTVHHIDTVNTDFHARHSASSRSYVYTIAHQRISLDRRRQWMLFAAFDHEAVRTAIPLLRGAHDFTTFSKYVPELHHHYCHVFDVRWESDGEQSRFHITANRFLHGMVRSIVGELARIGRGKSTTGDLLRLLTARDRVLSPMLAPAHGLVLRQVSYDADERAIVTAVMNELRAADESTSE